MAAEVTARLQEQLDENKRQIAGFLLDDKEYTQKVAALSQSGKTRLIVNLNDLRKKLDGSITNKILQDPTAYIVPYEEALKEAVAHNDPNFIKTMKKSLRVGFDGSFGRHHVTPRGLTSLLVSKLVCVEGIVTKSTPVRPKLTQSVHYAPASGEVVVREHRDMTCMTKGAVATTAGAVPKTDENGNPMETEYGLCSYKDSQRFTIQEMPESAPTGQLPRSVDVVCEEDLVDSVKPGDRVRVIGVYRPLARRDGNLTNGVFKTVIIANNIQPLRRDVLMPTMTSHDVRSIKEIANREDTFDLLARSFAPSLCGHEYVKRGLLLLLLGGAEKNLPNGTHLRGDIHLLMIGDPSCGKSQMLRFVMNTAPLAISTTGRGSSGVGLTAAVTIDKDTNERRLEAGAMVLADRGVVCIDEFDKMAAVDRVAIHEVMEQQTVTIAKAGIHTSLNARCSVVAAANPVYGNWDDKESLNKQIAFPDSLLSRFDLIFIVRDLNEDHMNRKIAKHVLKQCQYRKAGEAGRRGDAIEAATLRSCIVEPDVEKQKDPTEETMVFERAHNIMHPQYTEDGEPLDVLTCEFLRKYIHFCRNAKHQPVLSNEAIKDIQEFYADLRQAHNNSGGGDQKPITARTLEAIIRLATAHAKLKLRDAVTSDDVMAAKRLLHYSLTGNELDEETPEGEEEGGDDVEMGDGDSDYQEEKKPRKKSTKKSTPETQGDAASGDTGRRGVRRGRKSGAAEEGGESQAEENAGQQQDRKRRRRAPPATQHVDAPAAAGGMSQTEVNTLTQQSADTAPQQDTQGAVVPVLLNARRLGVFTQIVSEVFADEESQMMQKEELLRRVAEKAQGEQAFTEGELEGGLQQLQDDNKLMMDVRSNFVYLIS